MAEPSAPSVTVAPKRLPVLLRRSWYGLNQAFRHRIAHLGITPDQFSILRWLNEGDPNGLTQRTLTDLMASDPNTITSTLTRMERNGLVSREPHERDRRAHRVRMRPKGRVAFEQGLELAITLQRQILGAIPAEKQDDFLESLAAVADACALASQRMPREKK
jgi:DNA-binding MarR family transcriptional regulator